MGVLAQTKRPAGFFLRAYRKVYQDAWLQLLSLHMPFDQCKSVLQLIPTSVLPHVSRPLMLRTSTFEPSIADRLRSRCSH